jgi:hypothetical protein
MTTDDDTDQIEESDIATAEVPMLANSTITQVEDAAMTLCVDEPEVELQSWLNLSSVLTARVKQIRQRIEQIAIKHIETHGPIVSGDLEYTVGYRNEVKCLDRQRTLDLILEASGGDLGSIVDYLRAEPFKYGSIRGLIGLTNYQKVFKNVARPKLNCGAPQLELLATNVRYVRSKTSNTRENARKAIAHTASET